MYIAIGGFVARLTENISWKTCYLPIERKKYEFLLDQLDDEDYSFLEIRDGRAIEIVKVINICGKLVLERAAEGTRPLAFRCGTSVAFTMTMQGVMDTVCQMESCNE